MATLVTTGAVVTNESNANGWRTWLAAAAMLTAAVVLLSDPFASPQEPNALPEELADEPDLYMQDALITQYLPTGRIKYQLASHQIRHFERGNLTRLTTPSLTLHNDPQPPWQVESDDGYIRRRANTSGAPEEFVFLRRNVVLQQHYEDGRSLRVETPSLYVFPDRQYAETAQTVMIDTDVGRTTSVGLRGDLQRGLLNVSSSAQRRVHTILLPGQFK